MKANILKDVILTNYKRWLYNWTLLAIGLVAGFAIAVLTANPFSGKCIVWFNNLFMYNL